jgi:hypothetical protein
MGDLSELAGLVNVFLGLLTLGTFCFVVALLVHAGRSDRDRKIDRYIYAALAASLARVERAQEMGSAKINRASQDLQWVTDKLTELGELGTNGPEESRTAKGEYPLFRKPNP